MISQSYAYDMMFNWKYNSESSTSYKYFINTSKAKHLKQKEIKTRK